MSAISKFLVFVFAILVMGSSDAVAQTAVGSDESAVRKVVQQVQDAWNAHDAKAFAAPFAVDADYVVINGLMAKGRTEIEKGHAGIFSTIYKESHNVGTVKSVRFIRPDVAVVHIEWKLEFKIGGEPRKGHAMNTMIMTKENGSWSIAAFQNTAIEEQRPQPPR